MATCQAWREDEEGNAIQTEGVCDREAAWVSCVPFVGAKTCAEHKCRCAKPIGDASGTMITVCPLSSKEEASLRKYLADPKNDFNDSHSDASVRRVFATLTKAQERIKLLEAELFEANAVVTSAKCIACVNAGEFKTISTIEMFGRLRKTLRKYDEAVARIHRTKE